MWRLYFICSITLSTAGVANDSAREVYYQGLLARQNITPTFDKGYMIVYDVDQIDVYRPDGWPMYKVTARVPNAKRPSIINAAVDTDGTLAGAVVYPRGGGIVIFDSAGTQTQFVDTGHYLPSQVCFDADHSIWILGWQEKRKLAERPEYFLLQHYSHDGQKLGAFLPRSFFAYDEFDVEPAYPNVGLWGIRMANNRLGAILGLAQGKMQWMEIDLTGKVLARWKITGDRHPAAFTAGGSLYARAGHGVSVFDRAGGNWKPVTGMPDGILLAADGVSLVVWMRNSNVLRWVPHP